MFRRWAPAAILLIPLAAALAAYLVLDAPPWRADVLLARRDALREAVQSAPLVTLALFMAVHFAIVSSALPIGPPMSLLAGFLFGRWLGTAVILIGSTAGALVVFTIARLAADTELGARLRARAGPAYGAMAAELRANAFGYLLVMRLVPVFPFFAVNLVAGLFGLPARVFAAATVIGRLPAAFLYVSLGEEVGRISGMDELASPRIFATLTAIGLLALVPVVLARRRRRRDRAGRT